MNNFRFILLAAVLSISLTANAKDMLGMCGSAAHHKLYIPDVLCFSKDGEVMWYAGCEKAGRPLEQGMMSISMMQLRKEELAKNPPAVVSLREVCQQHDSCYDTKGVKRSTCDTQFYKSFNNACRDSIQQSFPEAGRKACYESAAYYNDVVRDKGCSSFKSAQKSQGVKKPSCN